MKRILFLLLLGVTMLSGQAFGSGWTIFLHSPDAVPTPSTTWNAGTAFTVCNSQQRSFRVQYNYDFHESCWANRYRVTIKLFWNGNLVASSGTWTLSSMFFDHTFTNVTVVPGAWHATATLERRPCLGSWYEAETVSTHTKTVTNHCLVFPPPCPTNQTISGTYTAALTEASSSITSSGATTIPNGANVKLDANDASNNGFIRLDPGFEAQAGSLFVAEALDGCGSGIPAKPFPTGIAEELTADVWRAFPNPATGIVTVQHPADVGALQLYGIDGKLHQVLDANTNGETKLDMAALPPGMYLIRANGREPIKVTKQ